MALRTVLLLDAAVLVALGGSFLLIPGQVALAFGFGTLPPAMHHLVGLWGCALVTLGAGTFAAALNPWRHVMIIRIGIARGALEFAVGLLHLLLGVATLRQAAPGLLAGGTVAIAYTVLYPPRPAAPAVAAPPVEEAEHAA